MNRRSIPSRRQAQSGQALTEFIVAALALVPLFLLIPMLAKYQDVSHSTQLASRYVAFDAMVRNDASSSWKAESQLADEVRRRFFSNADAPIKTGDVAGDFKAHQNLFWRTPDDQPLVRRFADVAIGFGPSNGATHADGFTAADDGALFGPTATQLGLRTQGLYTANVSVTLANLPAGIRALEPFDNVNLSMSRGTTVLIDPWTAKDSGQVMSRIAGAPAVFPVASLRSASTLLDAAVLAIDWPGGLSGPRIGDMGFWRDIVPGDRLQSRN